MVALAFAYLEDTLPAIKSDLDAVKTLETILIGLNRQGQLLLSGSRWGDIDGLSHHVKRVLLEVVHPLFAQIYYVQLNAKDAFDFGCKEETLRHLILIEVGKF